MPLFPRAKVTRVGRYKNYVLGMAAEVAAVFVLILVAFGTMILLFLLGRI